MSLDQFELLELRRDGSIQTYHAREIATARPVQVHLFIDGHTAETTQLLGMVSRLPGPERRRVIDRGEARGLPYLVTDRLAGYADISEWLSANAAAAAAPAQRTASVDEQFMALFDSPAMAGPAAYGSAAAPARAPEPEPSTANNFLDKAIEIEALQPHRGFLPTAAKSFLWLILGIVAALAFLAAVGAFFVFHH